MNLTPEEQTKAHTIIAEGVKKSSEIARMFEEGMRGMMVFMAAMEALRIRHPGVFNMVDRTKAIQMIGHWVAAGEPENPGEVPARLLKRYGPDVFQKIEEEYAEGEAKP